MLLSSLLLVLAVAAAGAYGLVQLDATVRSTFEGRRWALPAHVYARPRQLHAGLPLTLAGLQQELGLRGYRRTDALSGPGTWSRTGATLTVHLRGFTGPQGPIQPQQVVVLFAGSHIAALTGAGGENISQVQLEPQRLGSILPLRHEDRAPMPLHQAPPALLQALLVMEDRRFMDHQGIDPHGVIRAAWRNLRAGRVVAGGSTLTQQLVKNLYLGSERTFQRKAREALMALLLEWHYSKSEILEAYVNEVFLGQSGNRAIHGFALASEHYFDRPLAELPLPALALLAGMVKAPSAFDPRRHPQRARARRNLVLAELARAGHLVEGELHTARQAPLGASARGGRAAGNSAFLDFVRRQAQRHFDPALLRIEGLRIYTTVDPLAQRAVELALAGSLGQLERSRQIQAGSLQGAALVVQVDTGEVLAVAGGREAAIGGFNRALDAVRPAGSLLKPAVYLTALARPDQYTLMTQLDDSEFEWREPSAPLWHPRNYDHVDHDWPPLIEALAHSYNVATARLGLAVGIDEVVKTLQNIGIVRSISPYPSLTLGAVELAPVEIAQMYQTIASGGHLAPLRTIHWIGDAAARPLARYPLRPRPAIDPAVAYLLNYALQEVVRSGTGRALAGVFPAELQLAGKTGTTGGYRDSWFAGYAGNILAVVWVGRDDNKPINLTGAAGALRVWSDLMARLPLRPVRLYQPERIHKVRLAGIHKGMTDAGCAGIRPVPFIVGSEPATATLCDTAERSGLQQWLKRWWQGTSATPEHDDTLR